MIVVSDTGPLRYLVEVGAVDVLPHLYGTVLIPQIVLEELRLDHFPPIVRA
jgi:predicted nucleic acid-binding protein